MADSLKRKTLKGTFWSATERFSVQIVTFVVMIVMANLLTPEDYGLVGMLTIFIAISQSLIDCGFSQALIRKQDRTELDNSTVFYFNVVVGIALYAVLFCLASFVADFYEEPLLAPLMRLISLSVIINSFVVVQRALLTAKIDFKTQAKSSLTAAIVAGVTGISLAYCGIGVWAIVWYQLANVATYCLMLWFMTQWRPRRIFSWPAFHEMFSFGSKLAVSGILNTIYNNILIVIIGKMFRATDLGHYTRAHQFADFPSATSTLIFQKVTYPVLCSIQNDDDRLRIIYRKFLRLSAYVIFPAMLGLAALAKPFILIVLNEQWKFTATLLPIVCVAMMWYPIHAINLNLLQVKGKSELILRLEVIKKSIGLVLIVATIPFGLIALCYGMVLSSVIALIINTHYTGKYLKLGFFLQMKDLLPTLLYSSSMALIVYGISLLFQDNLLKLFIGMLTGVSYYIFIGKVTRSGDLNEFLSILKSR